jgi:tyrosine-protein phosphatase YwqE
MFHFLKKNVLLKELIPANYVDIHSHLLPGIDDGAVTIDDTILLLTELKKLGVTQSITTPHIHSNVWKNTKESIEQKYLQTVVNLDEQVPLRFAAEYMIDPNFEKLFQNDPLLTLKDNYVLIEISYINAPIQLYDILFELQIAGYKPVLAHPERYPYYYSNLQAYTKLKNAGCLFQLNLLSTVGYYGVDVAKSCELLLKKGLIDFVGSDVHHNKHIESFSNKILVKDLQPLKTAIENNQFFRE